MRVSRFRPSPTTATGTPSPAKSPAPGIAFRATASPRFDRGDLLPFAGQLRAAAGEIRAPASNFIAAVAGAVYVTRAAVLASLALFALPSAAAGEGTEEEPELRDSEGDIAYAPSDFQKASDFLDISASWLEYDADSDAVAYTLRVKDASALQNPQSDPYWRCETRIDLRVEGSDSGSFSAQWYKSFGSSQVGSNINYRRPEGAPASGEAVKVEHNFTFTPDAPGYFRWEISRDYVQNLAQTLTGLQVACTELIYVDQIPTGGRNMDEATGTGSFDLTTLEPERGRPDETSTEETVTTDPTIRSSGANSVGALAVLLALVVSILARRRK